MRSIVAMSCIAIALICSACPGLEEGEDILANKYEVVFPSNGGCDTIVMTSDQESWWLQSVMEDLWSYMYIEACDCEQLRGKEVRRYIFNPKKYNISMNSFGWCEMTDSLSVKAEDYSIYIPEDNPKTLIIECNENKTNYEKTLSISLRVHEYRSDRCWIYVRQKASDE